MSEDKKETLQAVRPPSLFIGLPTYDGRIEYKTVRGLVQLSAFCGAKGIRFGIDVVPGDAFISKARNTIAKRFMNSGFDELLFIDADVGFDIDSVRSLMRSDVDIAAGLYRVKEDKMKFPGLLYDPLERHPNDPRLLKMQYVPAGFMKIRRKVFEKLIEKYPEEYYHSGDMHHIYDHFPCGRVGNHFTGEDISFCQRVIAAGFDIWGVQGINLIHTGAKAFEACWQIDVELAKPMHIPVPIEARAA